ncbi:sensor histidine kinase [Ferruginibacter sp. SUN106]|uniref:sensor histidine kinase n=1 Tax=Ferruginibacter sp. SUN106 TaxID=2978348 RepID=UPI003D36D1AE
MRNSLLTLRKKRNPATAFFLSKLSGKLKRLTLSISLTGVIREKDESKQMYIIQMNLIAIVTFLINSLTGFLFFFIDDILPGLMFIFSGIVWLLPIFLNRNGLTISSRLLLIIFSVAMLFLASCWFSHNTMLDNFFLILAIDCNFVYSYHERKWLLISIILCLAFFIIETTSLQNYLPALNALKDIPATNIVLLISQILTVFIDVMVYIYITRLREKNLLLKQQKIAEAQAKVQLQNDDLKTFSIAASHTMQTPLHVSAFFLEKIESELRDKINGETKKNLELVKNGLQQIDLLVTGLFSYNRIINIENELTQFDVMKEIDIIRKSIVLRYPKARILLTESAFFIKANQLLFSTIIYNLIDNGIKYNLSPIPEVAITYEKIKSSVFLIVRDNGIGIPEKYFTSIFLPFKRIQNDSRFKTGNGLGLACAKRAAERMQGNLTCSGSSKSGSVFKLEIPLV